MVNQQHAIHRKADNDNRNRRVPPDEDGQKLSVSFRCNDGLSLQQVLLNSSDPRRGRRVRKAPLHGDETSLRRIQEDE